jgi:uncharacterized protein (TIGR02145 family)
MKVSLCLILSVLLSSGLVAQTEKKVAIVIGNGNYSMPLGNPENDARAMASALQKLGFTVFKYENLTQGQMKRAIDDFGDKLIGSDVGLFYYAGHGIQAKGFNYLIPVDARLKTEEEVDYDCVRADRVLALMEKSGTKVNVLILDACRNNPFERSWTRSANGQGLAFMSAPTGTMIAYATSPGSTASDGSGSNGLYTSAILESIVIPGITIEEMFKNVRKIVSKKSQNQQIPWEATSLTGDFYFSRPADNGSGSNNNNQSRPSEGLNNSLSDSKKRTTTKPAVNNVSPITGSFTDPVESRTYMTVKIGDQVWMAENLSSTKFNDGSDIPLITDDSQWRELKTPGFCWYHNNKAAYGSTFGALYNWYCVKTGKLCPVGWHVPTDAEWTTLSDNMGGESVAAGKMKEAGTSHWENPNNGATDESGFNALPGGMRFNSFFPGCSWWTSSENNYSSAWTRNIVHELTELKRLSVGEFQGSSIRCIKDL